MQTENPWLTQAMRDQTFITRHHIAYTRVDMSRVEEPNQIGIGIPLTGAERFVNLEDLIWRRHPSGHYTAIVAYTATKAAALRIALNLNGFPEKLTVKFISDDKTKPYPKALLDYATASEYLTRDRPVHWSPIYPGDTLYLELNHPDIADPGFSEARLELPQISYIFEDNGPWGPPHKNIRGTEPEDTVSGQASVPPISECGTVDLSCDADGIDLSDDFKDMFSRATGFLLFTNNRGDTNTCTGHLINERNNSGTPYMLTAAHCVDSQAQADSLVVYWDYRSNSCGGDVDVGDFPNTTGAQLLVTVPRLDSSLLWLNSTPPGNRAFLGWDNSPPELSEQLFHIGHSSRNPQSYAQGVISELPATIMGSFLLMIIDADLGVFGRGSSGSVFIDQSGNARSGGTSRFLDLAFTSVCSLDDGVYDDRIALASFADLYPHISQYIDIDTSTATFSQHGNTTKTATPLSINNSEDGQITAENSIDYFRVAIPSTSQLTIYIVGGADTVITLEDNSGTLLASDDSSRMLPDFRIRYSLQWSIKTCR